MVVVKKSLWAQRISYDGSQEDMKDSRKSVVVEKKGDPASCIEIT